MVPKEIIEKILPDWKVIEYSNGFDVLLDSPAGEEWCVPIQGESLQDMARFVEEYYNDFDPEDHASQIYHAKHYGSEDEQMFYAGAPDSLQDLIEDAKWIDSRIWDIREALWNEWLRILRGRQVGKSSLP